MKIFIKKSLPGAWEYINLGYKNAFESFGFECYYYDNILDLKNEKNYYLFANDSDLINDTVISVFKNAIKAFLFIMPNTFPKHWGLHQNWLTSCKINFDEINNLNNIVQWTFLEQSPYFYKWLNYLTLPLAFDDITYKFNYDKNFNFDVCYVGGWANNGFDEKKKNILKHFSKVKEANLKCGIFVNKNISSTDEIKIISNSNICLNIHDDYQRELGLDSNERTFKSLGLNGILVSDEVEQIRKIIPDIKMSNDPEIYIQLIKEYLSNPYINDIRERNRNHILKNHTYKNRVNELLNA